MIKMAIIHNNVNNFFSEILTQPANYEVMDVFSVVGAGTQALSGAYAKSQNFANAWRNTPCRSTSIGDLILMETGELYMVARIGFLQITDTSFVAEIYKKFSQNDTATTTTIV